MKLIEKFRAASKKALSASADLQLAVEELRGELFRLKEEERKINDTPRSREEIAATISTKFDRLESEALSRLIPDAFWTAHDDRSVPIPIASSASLRGIPAHQIWKASAPSAF